MWLDFFILFDSLKGSKYILWVSGDLHDCILKLLCGQRRDFQTNTNSFWLKKVGVVILVVQERETDHWHGIINGFIRTSQATVCDKRLYLWMSCSIKN